MLPRCCSSIKEDEKKKNVENFACCSLKKVFVFVGGWLGGLGRGVGWGGGGAALFYGNLLLYLVV